MSDYQDNIADNNKITVIWELEIALWIRLIMLISRKF